MELLFKIYHNETVASGIQCSRPGNLQSLHLSPACQRTWGFAESLAQHDDVFRVMVQSSPRDGAVRCIRSAEIFANLERLDQIFRNTMCFDEETTGPSYVEPCLALTRFLNGLLTTRSQAFHFRIEPQKMRRFFPNSTPKRCDLKITEEIRYSFPRRGLAGRSEVKTVRAKSLVKRWTQKGAILLNSDGNEEIRRICNHIQTKFDESYVCSMSLVVCPPQCMDSWKYHAQKHSLRHKTILNYSSLKNLHIAQEANLDLIILNVEFLYSMIPSEILQQKFWNAVVLHMLPLEVLYKLDHAGIVTRTNYRYLFYTSYWNYMQSDDFVFLPYFLCLGNYSDVNVVTWNCVVQRSVKIENTPNVPTFHQRVGPVATNFWFMKDLQISPESLYRDPRDNPHIRSHLQRDYLRIQQETETPFFDEEGNECVICYDGQKNTLLKCGHRVCHPCFLANIEQNRLACPFCNLPIRSGLDACYINDSHGSVAWQEIRYGPKNGAVVSLAAHDFREHFGTIVMVRADRKTLDTLHDILKQEFDGKLPIWHLRGRAVDKRRALHNFRTTGRGLLFAEPFADFLEGLSMPWVRNIILYLPFKFDEFYPILSPHATYTTLGHAKMHYDSGRSETKLSRQIYSNFQNYYGAQSGHGRVTG